MLGGLVATVLALVYPAFTYLVVDAVRILGSCNPVTIPFYVDLNISIGMNVHGTFQTHNVTIHDRCLDYPYAQAADGVWSTTGVWRDQAAYSCADYEMEGWCVNDSFASSVTVETLHIDGDSDGFCDFTGDNCTFIAIDDPETTAIEDTPKGPPFETGSGKTAWGCDCNSSLANTGQIYDEPWYANMSCCGCGGGKAVNTFYVTNETTHMVAEALAPVEFFSNITLFGCSSYKVGAETVLDCDAGRMDRNSCVRELSAASGAAFQLILVVGAACVVGWVLLSVTLGRIYSRGVRELREHMFETLMRQDVEWHDRQQHVPVGRRGRGKETPAPQPLGTTSSAANLHAGERGRLGGGGMVIGSSPVQSSPVQSIPRRSSVGVPTDLLHHVRTLEQDLRFSSWLSLLFFCC